MYHLIALAPVISGMLNVASAVINAVASRPRRRQATHRPKTYSADKRKIPHHRSELAPVSRT